MNYRYLTLPLKLIFQKSLQTSEFPTEWKKANVIPIHKKDDKHIITNYRPVSILNIFSKLFECIVYPFVASYCKQKICIDQHGFFRSRSTVTNLVSFISDVSKSIDCRNQVDVIYTDFSSAFDRVDHSILIYKLKRFGIHGPLLLWFQSYLKHRSLRVTFAGYHSKTYIASSGVPQGSHLGPLLFVLFVNDIPDHLVYSKCLLFADDVKLYKAVSCAQDSQDLQKDLHALSNWCQLNNMTLNAGKCVHIKLTKNKKTISTCYFVGSEQLQEVTSVRDLGVIVDSKLNFIKHIDKVVSKAWKMVGFVKRTCRDFKNIAALLCLYNALVRSILEYATTVWNPHYQNHIVRLERVQKAFTRYLAYKDPSCPLRVDYITRLKHFKLISLEDRRNLHDLSFVHKLINGSIDAPNLLSQLYLAVPRKIPRYPLKCTFRKARYRTKISAPLNRAMEAYNDKNDIDIFNSSIVNFKSSYIKSLLHHC